MMRLTFNTFFFVRKENVFLKRTTKKKYHLLFNCFYYAARSINPLVQIMIIRVEKGCFVFNVQHDNLQKR